MKVYARPLENASSCRIREQRFCRRGRSCCDFEHQVLLVLLLPLLQVGDVYITDLQQRAQAATGVQSHLSTWLLPTCLLFSELVGLVERPDKTAVK